MSNSRRWLPSSAEELSAALHERPWSLCRDGHRLYRHFDAHRSGDKKLSRCAVFLGRSL